MERESKLPDIYPKEIQRPSDKSIEDLNNPSGDNLSKDLQAPDNLPTWRQEVSSDIKEQLKKRQSNSRQVELHQQPPNQDADFGYRGRSKADIARFVGTNSSEGQDSIYTSQRSQDIEKLQKSTQGLPIDEGTRANFMEGSKEQSPYEATRETKIDPQKGFPTLSEQELLNRFRTSPQYLSTAEITQAHRLLPPNELRDLPADLLDDNDLQRVAVYEEEERKRLEAERIRAEYEAKRKLLLDAINETKKDLDRVVFELQHLGDSVAKGQDIQASEEVIPESTLGQAYDTTIDFIKGIEIRPDTMGMVLVRLEAQLENIKASVNRLKAYNERFASKKEELIKLNKAFEAVAEIPIPENPYLNSDFETLIGDYVGLNPETDSQKREQIKEILLGKKTEIESEAFGLKKEYDEATSLEDKSVIVEKIQKVRSKLEFFQSQFGQNERDIIDILEGRIKEYAFAIQNQKRKEADQIRAEQDLQTIRQRQETQTVVSQGIENLRGSRIRQIQEKINLNARTDRYYPEVVFDLVKSFREGNTAKEDNLLGAMIAFDKNEDGIKDQWAEVKRKQQIKDALDDNQRQNLTNQEQTIKDFFEKYQVQSVESATA